LRYAPTRPLPPYAYVPGSGTPHPRKDPRGHSYGEPERLPPPLDPDDWEASSDYLYAIDLFNHGFYWEAHEALEGLWVAAGKAGAVAELLKGLIKLCAAGVKERQGMPGGVEKHVTAAARHLAVAGHAFGDGSCLGLSAESLRRALEGWSGRGAASRRTLELKRL
jgi:uncharacterized protein